MTSPASHRFEGPPLLGVAAARLPTLRNVEILPFRRQNGEIHFALHDPLQLAETIAVSAAGYFVLTHFDGAHTCADVTAEFRRQTGMELPISEIARLIVALDGAFFLHGPRFEAALEARRAAYLAAPARDCRDRYPPEPELRRALENILKTGKAASIRDLRGLIAPHLDYERGAPCYADAYATLAAAAPAERYVILGTNHAGLSDCVVATSKDFVTPLGRAPVDTDFLAALETRLGASLREHEEDHLHEHSIELQVHFLQVLAGPRPFQIVPVLCRGVDAPECETDSNGQFAQLRRFARVLGELMAGDRRRTILVAGADLSHVGQRFGDSEPTTPAFLQSIGQSDRALLSLLGQRNEAEFVAQLSANGNPTRICSTACIYAALQALPDQPCRILAYHQAVNLEAETHVTCTAAAIG